ncbi:hypothetical protein EYF80_060010 [Liparis tanakae]|uniref:Uncharacterized protein n=1 Tax=Liparis tanakae TaxID=230148 RepID=A0A4Z2EMQ2_9TELE|nr:hypothetical protein EYF80_060010 [Liparis tanakae]
MPVTCWCAALLLTPAALLLPDPRWADYSRAETVLCRSKLSSPVSLESERRQQPGARSRERGHHGAMVGPSQDHQDHHGATRTIRIVTKPSQGHQDHHGTITGPLRDHQDHQGQQGL